MFVDVGAGTGVDVGTWLVVGVGALLVVFFEGVGVGALLVVFFEGAGVGESTLNINILKKVSITLPGIAVIHT